MQLGCKPKERVAVLVRCHPDNFTAELACYCSSMVTVMVAHSTDKHVMGHILDQIEPPTVVCDEHKVQLVIDLCSSRSIPVKRIVSIGSPSEADQSQAKQLEIELTTLKEVEALGKSRDDEPVHPEPDDWATICHTSGTNGLPKGVVLTHANLIAMASCISANWLRTTRLNRQAGEQQVLFCVGGGGHILYRHLLLNAMQTNSCIGFSVGASFQPVLEDLRKIRPTTLVALPALLNAMQEHFNLRFAKNFLMKLLLKWQIDAVRQGYDVKGNLIDRFVFSQMQKHLGGRLEICAVGSASLVPGTAHFIRAALACSVVEGYGTTETGAGGTLSLADDTSHGSVGPPMLCNHIKLVSVENMGYDAFYGQGEVCVKGANMGVGYWTKGGEVKSFVDDDGWYHTGDIGRWRKNGSLEIVDRIRNVIRLSIGKDVAPERIESVFMEIPFVSNIFLYGSPSRACCVAVVVPCAELLVNWMKTEDPHVVEDLDDTTSICQNNIVRRAVMRHLTEHGQKQGLAPHELPYAIFLTPTPFKDIPSMLTNTMKHRRNHLKEHFAEAIKEMYSKLSPQAGSRHSSTST